MEVHLLAYTPLPADLVARAGRSCYSEKPSSDIMLTQDKIRQQLKIIHPSVFEHIVFTFSVSGVSRVLQQQLTRHRFMSFSIQSMRYVDIHKLWEHMVIPATVQEMLDDEEELAENRRDEELANCIENYKWGLSQLIDKLTEMGIPSEDVRYFAPLGTECNITLTTNYRELMQFCGLRRCTRAQAEIRELADRIAEILRKECPELWEAAPLVPQCEQLGYCPEHRCCGRFHKLKTLVSPYLLDGDRERLMEQIRKAKGYRYDTKEMMKEDE